tara:strand:- start:92 stop:994 length:903 start_codon:yes stop_codon:yes gene_type:complete
MTFCPKIQLAHDGPEISKLIQGYWRLADWDMNSQQRLSFIERHVESGVSTVDHAFIYGDPACESLFGEALKLAPQLRREIEIISKCGIVSARPGKVAHYSSSKSDIVASVETSLKRLGTDYLDILLIHRPDFLMDADEVAGAFQALKQAGKVNHFGVSNFDAAQLSLLQSRLDAPLVTNQIELNPVNTQVAESGLLEYLQERRIRPMAWSCLAGGRVFNDTSTAMQRLRNTLQLLVHELSASSIDQVIYAWVMKMPSQPLPIIGSGNVRRMQEAVAALSLPMSREQWYRVLSAARGRDVD